MTDHRCPQAPLYPLELRWLIGTSRGNKGRGALIGRPPLLQRVQHVGKPESGAFNQARARAFSQRYKIRIWSHNIVFRMSGRC